MGLRALLPQKIRWPANFTYLGSMGFGSVFGLVRGFVVAALLNVGDFGLYGVVVAVAAFFSPLIGLGRIEESRKLFPRLAAEGRHSEVGHEVASISAQILLRTALVGFVIALGVWIWLGMFSAIIVVCSAGLLFGNAACMVLASALRAGTDLRHLGYSALARGIVTFAFVVAGAYQFGLIGVLAGEALAAVIAAAIMRAMLSRAARETDQIEARPYTVEAYSKQRTTQGRLLLMAGLLLAFPLYMSRPLVGLIFSAELLGTFSFLSLFFAATATLYSITDQIIGPQLVRMQHNGDTNSKQKQRLAKFSTIIMLLTGLGLACAFSALTLPALANYRTKFAIDLTLIVPTILFCILQTTSTIDWLLQAHDREKSILLAAGTYTALFMTAFGFAAATDLSLDVILWAMVVSKTGQLIVQLRVVSLLNDAAISGSSR